MTGGRRYQADARGARHKESRRKASRCGRVLAPRTAATKSADLSAFMVSNSVRATSLELFRGTNRAADGPSGPSKVRRCVRRDLFMRRRESPFALLA